MMARDLTNQSNWGTLHCLHLSNCSLSCIPKFFLCVVGFLFRSWKKKDQMSPLWQSFHHYGSSPSIYYHLKKVWLKESEKWKWGCLCLVKCRSVKDCPVCHEEDDEELREIEMMEDDASSSDASSSDDESSDASSSDDESSEDDLGWWYTNQEDLGLGRESWRLSLMFCLKMF